MSDIVLPLTAGQVVSRLQAWTTPIVLVTTVGTKPTGLAGLILDGNGATGNFSLSLSPANLTAARRWSFPDRTDTVAGLGAQTFTGAQTIAAVTLITDTTDATSLTAAALVCNGGAAVAKVLRVGLGILSGRSVNITGANPVAAASQLVLAQASASQGTINAWGASAGVTGALNFQCVSSDASISSFPLSLTHGTPGTPGADQVLIGNGVIKAAGNLIIGTDPGGSQLLRVGGAVRINSATLISTATAFTNGAAAAAGTLLNAPVAGNPSKWVPFDDNGTTRYFPAW